MGLFQLIRLNVLSCLLFLLIIIEYCCSSIQENNGGKASRLVESEYLLLKEIYEKTNGPYWKNNENWNFSDPFFSNPCHQLWYGVSFVVSSLNHTLCHISTITLNNNNLTGILPNFIALPSLMFFLVGRNRLHGNLPKFESPFLGGIEFSYNSFSGSIPMDMFVNGQELREIRLEDNLITGTLPSWIYSLKNLRNLYLHDNHFSGTLSSNGTNQLTSLRLLFLQNNQFHGSMSFFFQLPMIKNFNADNNFFSGTLPTIFTGSNTASPLAFSVAGNNLEGPLPIEYRGNIETLFLSSNYFTGTLSSSLCTNYYQLHFFGVGDNQLHGTIPSCFWRSRALTLEFDFNLFHGPILINMSSLSQSISRGELPLSFVSIGFNHFSGTFPSQLLEYPQLVALSAPNNCFKGGFQTISCENISPVLKYIDFDALYAPHSCIQGYDLFKSTRYFGGPLPHCLFVLNKVLDVSLSGNGFSGTITEYFNVTDFGFKLNLSRNFLVGTLPRVFERLSWSKLDLSYNKLNGILPNLTFTESKGPTSLNLNNNRFSFVSVPFSLDIDRVALSKGNLLQEDNLMPIRRAYPDSFSVSESGQIFRFVFYYFIVGSIAIFLAVVGWVFRFYDLSDNSQKINLIRDFSSIRLLLLCMIIVGVSLLPCFYFFHISQYTNDYKMYENTYNWNVSSLYLRGYLPGGIIASVLIILNLVFQFNYPLRDHINPQMGKANRLTSRVDYSLIIGFYLIVFSLNFILSFAANKFYFKLQKNSFMNTEASSTKLHLIQVIMVTYNMIWNRYLLVWIFHYLQSLSENVISQRRQFEYLIVLLLMNSVVIPWISTLLSAEDCFEGLISSTSEINQLIGEAECNWWERDSDSKICHRYSSFSLPFLYFNLCSSQFLIRQLPLWIYYYSSMPIVYLFEKFIQEAFTRRNSNQSVEILSVIWKTDIIFDFSLLLCYGIHYPLLSFIIFFKIAVEYFVRKMQTRRAHAWEELSIDSSHEIEMHTFETDDNRIENQGSDRTQRLRQDISRTSLTFPFLIVFLSFFINSLVLFDMISDTNGATEAIYFVGGVFLTFVVINCIFLI